MKRVVCVLLGLALGIEGEQVLTGSVSIPAKKFNVPESVVPRMLSDTRVSVVSKGSLVFTTTVAENGLFSLRTLLEGEYLVYTSHPVFQFDPVVVHVAENEISARSYDPVRTGHSPIPNPLRLVPTAFQSPYLPEEEFNVLDFFKNPMVIMGLVMLGIVWLMPKLQGSMTPEEMGNMRKELEQEGGIAASFLKNMIPSAPGSAVGGALPSIAPSSVGKKNQ